MPSAVSLRDLSFFTGFSQAEITDLDRALAAHPGIALTLARVMVERLERTNRNAGVDFVSLSRLEIDPRVLTLLPAPLANTDRCVPIAFSNNRLTLAARKRLPPS